MERSVLVKLALASLALFALGLAEAARLGVAAPVLLAAWPAFVVYRVAIGHPPGGISWNVYALPALLLLVGVALLPRIAPRAS